MLGREPGIEVADTLLFSYTNRKKHEIMALEFSNWIKLKKKTWRDNN